MRLISFSVCYFAILPIFHAVIAAPPPVVPDIPKITLSAPKKAHVALPHLSRVMSASDPNRLGGSVWPGTRKKNHFSRQHRTYYGVSKPSRPKKHKRRHQPQVTPKSEFKEMLAKFGDMKISDGQGSKEKLAKFRDMKIGDGQKDEEVDQEMSNT